MSISLLGSLLIYFLRSYKHLGPEIEKILVLTIEQVLSQRKAKFVSLKCTYNKSNKKYALYENLIAMGGGSYVKLAGTNLP